MVQMAREQNLQDARPGIFGPSSRPGSVPVQRRAAEAGFLQYELGEYRINELWSMSLQS